MKIPTKKNVVEGLLITGGVYVGYRIVSNLIKNHQQRNTADGADKSPATRQAMGLRSAMNPSGMSWLMWTDGTNEDAIDELASQIVDLNAVSVAYRRLYNSELTQDLQKELSTNHFNEFLTRISNNRINQSSSSPGSSSGAYTAPMRMIVAKKNVFVRTSPDASYHGAWYEKFETKNIYKTSKAGEFIGYATGKQHYDSKNKVKFIEVVYKIGPLAPDWLKPHMGQTKILWVSSSSNYVEQFSDVKSMEAKYPRTKGVTKYRLPVSGMGWLSQPGSRVISSTDSELFDKRFNAIGQVQSNVLLGYPVMTLGGGEDDFTLVRTLQGQDRWIATKNTITQ